MERAVAAANKVAASTGRVAQPLFDRLKNNRIVGKIGKVLSKLQLSVPIHSVDALITYMIGVVSGMEDMAQVRMMPRHNFNG